MTDKQSQKKTLLICFILGALTFAAFEGVCKNDFVNYDDDGYVTDNLQIQKGLSFESVGWAFTNQHTGIWHPLTWISHIIDYSIFGDKPAGHHLVSVGFHIANVILLFLILKQMTGSLWPSFFVSAVFGLHPLAVESVAWVAERKNVLSTFFAFLTIAAYLLYTKKPSVRRYLLIVVLFAAGLLSKPMLVTLPFVLILLDSWPISRIDFKFSILNSLYEKVPLLLMSAASCVVTYIAQAATNSMTGITALPLSVRAVNALMSYARYIGKVFYPVSLAVLYPFDVKGPASWQVGLSILLLLFATAAVIKTGRRRGYLFTGWFWYLGTLVPVIGLVQVGVQGMADRYMYLPGIGIYIIAVWLAGDLAARFKLPKAVLWAGGVLILGILLAMTRVQVRYWQNSTSLYEHTLAVTRNNYVIHINYATLLRKAGRLDEAIAHYRRAAEINPNEALIYSSLGYALREKGMLADAASAFVRSLEIKPSADICGEYGIMLAEQGRYDEAIGQFNRALDIDPDFPGALHNMYRAGIKGGKIDKVLLIMRGREQKTPLNAELYYRAGLLYGMKGETESAIKQLEKAVALRPDYIAARGELGDAFSRAGRFRECAVQYDGIVRLDPNNVKALCAYSLLLATSPEKDARDPQRAWSLADKACRLTDYNQPEPLDVLSQACAARGELTAAVETAQKALKAATTQGKDELAGQIKGRLELYKREKQGKE